MVFLTYIATALAAYLLGSIPTGYLVAKAKGIDIRTAGSGNIGATNAMRVLGKPAGIFVLTVDALKGWLAVWLLTRLAMDYLLPLNSPGGARELVKIVAGLSAIAGHNYTCWLKFKGGKGIATSCGVYFALAPLAAALAVGTWIITFFATRYVSIASIVSAIALPTAVALTQDSMVLIVITIGIGALAICKHKTNMQRLLDGTEPRFGAKDPPTPPIA